MTFWTGMREGHLYQGSPGLWLVYESNCFWFSRTCFIYSLFKWPWTTLLNRLLFSFDSVSGFGLYKKIGQWSSTGKCSKIRHSILMRTYEIFLGRHPVYRRSRAKIIQKKVKSKKALILVSLCFSMVNVKLDLFKVAPMATNPQFPTATIPHDRARIGQRAHCRAASKSVGKWMINFPTLSRITNRCRACSRSGRSWW